MPPSAAELRSAWTGEAPIPTSFMVASCPVFEFVIAPVGADALVCPAERSSAFASVNSAARWMSGVNRSVS